MNDRAQVGDASDSDFRASATLPDHQAFYKEPRRLLTALAGGALVLSGVARRSAFGLGLAAAGASLTYRAITGRTLESAIKEVFSRWQKPSTTGETASTRGQEAGSAAH